ncbi:MAG: SCP2 sterol-binding domain-containing protein [Candidatus Hodarchaeota archaeon]
MARFGTSEWIGQFVTTLNNNEAYAEAAETWEGDFLFIVWQNKEAGLDEEIVMWMDLWHGKCRDHAMLTNRTEKETAFIYEGELANWKEIIEGRLDPIKALLTRKMKLTGDRAKVMRATRAAKELVRTAQMIKTEF